MNKRTITIFVIVFLFSLFGMFMLNNVVHELSHKHDFREIAYDESICILEYGSKSVASYSFNDNNRTEYERISKYTELKAYGITFLLQLLYFTCVWYILFYLYITNKELKEIREVSNGKQTKHR